MYDHQRLALKQQLDPHQLAILDSEMTRRKKEPVAAFLLCFFLGCFGAHQFYLGRTNLGVTMLLITVIGVWFFGIGLIVTGIWSLINCFTVWSDCATINDGLESSIIASLAGSGSPYVPLRT